MQVIFVPASTGTRREIARKVVLFPAPLAPMMHAISPSSIWKHQPMKGLDIVVGDVQVFHGQQHQITLSLPK